MVSTGQLQERLPPRQEPGTAVAFNAAGADTSWFLTAASDMCSVPRSFAVFRLTVSNTSERWYWSLPVGR